MSATGDRSMIRIEPFDGDPDKWPDWKENFIAIAIVLGFADILVKGATRPTDDAEGKAWDKNNKEGFARMILCTKGVPQGIVKEFRATMNGQGAWEALESKYEQGGEARISALHDQLINTDFNWADDPESYFLRFAWRRSSFVLGSWR